MAYTSSGREFCFIPALKSIQRCPAPEQEAHWRESCSLKNFSSRSGKLVRRAVEKQCQFCTWVAVFSSQGFAPPLLAPRPPSTANKTRWGDSNRHTANSQFSQIRKRKKKSSYLNSLLAFHHTSLNATCFSARDTCACTRVKTAAGHSFPPLLFCRCDSRGSLTTHLTG